MTEISSFTLINEFVFLKALQNEILAKREKSFLRVYVNKALLKSVTSFFLAKLLRAIVESSSSKKTSHFPRQLKEDLEALFKRARNLFGSEIE